MEKYIYLNRIFVKYANGHMKEMNYYDGVPRALSGGKDSLVNSAGKTAYPQAAEWSWTLT